MKTVKADSDTTRSSACKGRGLYYRYSAALATDNTVCVCVCVLFCSFHPGHNVVVYQQCVHMFFHMC